MPNEDKTFSGSFVLDLRIWWRQVHTLYMGREESRVIDAQFQATGLRREKMGTSVDETPVKIVHKQVYLE